MKLLVVMMMLAGAAAAPLEAQADRTAAAATSPFVVAMRRLEFLIGEWEGTGWIRTGPQAQATFAQRERVRYAAGGSVVVVDGLGTSTVRGPTEGAIVHQAFAVVSYDTTGKTYRWRAYRAGDDEILATPEIGDGRLVWGMRAGPTGRIRFTIVLTPAGEWHEVGEINIDGSAWMQFFEMTLRRVG